MRMRSNTKVQTGASEVKVENIELLTGVSERVEDILDLFR